MYIENLIFHPLPNAIGEKNKRNEVMSFGIKKQKVITRVVGFLKKNIYKTQSFLFLIGDKQRQWITIT